MFLSFLTRMTFEDGCARASCFQPWSQCLVPSVNSEQKRSLSHDSGLAEYVHSLYGRINLVHLIIFLYVPLMCRKMKKKDNCCGHKKNAPEIDSLCARSIVFLLSHSSLGLSKTEEAAIGDPPACHPFHSNPGVVFAVKVRSQAP